MIALTQVHADAAFRLIKTLRRLDLAIYPSGKYETNTEHFNVWLFAEKYGVVDDEKSEE